MYEGEIMKCVNLLVPLDRISVAVSESPLDRSLSFNGDDGDDIDASSSWDTELVMLVSLLAFLS